MRPEMVYSYVRDLVETMTGRRPEPDDDGDLLIDYGGAHFYIRIINNDPIVQVFAIVLADVEPSSDLLVDLNQMNADLIFGRAFHVAGQVLIEHEIWGSDVNPANLDYACRMVASGADAYGQRLADKFGGKPAFEDSKRDYQMPVHGENGYGMNMGFRSPGRAASL